MPSHLIFEDERGVVLWERGNGEYQPPGTLVTDYDGTRYLVTRVQPAVQEDITAYRMQLKPVSTWPPR